LKPADLRIAVTGLGKRFAERPVLDGVSLEFRPGETVVLIGPSGGGKSTLLRCINGLATFDAGEVAVGPHRLAPETARPGSPGGGAGGNAAAARRIRRLVGMIFQDFQLFPHLTALQNVIEAPIRVLGRSRAEAERNARDLLRRVGLAEAAGTFPRALSGGQKQRVAIARALAMEPRALLCDEITSALDPELKADVLAMLRTLKEDGITLLVVTHEIGFARRAADRVIVLDGGRIVEDGPPGQVLDAPGNPRVRQFLDRILS
jgi:polar amino acid transport system ATP-binding protein